MAQLDKRTKGALWLLIGPTALLIVVFFLYALLNWVTGADITTTLETLRVALNAMLFIAGLISILVWIPGIVIGIILLVTKK